MENIYRSATKARPIGRQEEYRCKILDLMNGYYRGALPAIQTSALIPARHFPDLGRYLNSLPADPTE